MWISHYKISRRYDQGCGVLIFCGTPTPTRQVKVGHRLLNLCDCGSALSERWRQTNSQNLKNKNNPILLRSYLNLISVIACSKTVHPWFGLLRTNHCFIIFCKIVKTGTAYAESSFLVGLRLRTPVTRPRHQCQRYSRVVAGQETLIVPTSWHNSRPENDNTGRQIAT